VQPGDIVFADVKGRRFYATVLARRPGELHVHPLDDRITYRHVRARDVRAIWLRSPRRVRQAVAA
jgi:hypothetical protein